MILLRAWRALWGRFGEIVSPPGSEWCLGLVVALAGWVAGLNAPYDINDAMLFGSTARRIFGGENPLTALPGLFQGLLNGPSPSLAAAGTALALLAVLAFSLGGWIMVASRMASGRSVEKKTWRNGVFGNGRMVAYYVLAALVLLFFLCLGAGAGTFILKSALAKAPLSIVPATLLGVGGLTVLLFTVAFGLYGMATAVMGGFVAIAEPEIPFFRLYSRGRGIFLAADGWDSFGWLFVLALLWAFLKTAISYLLLPFPIAGALMLGIGMAVDGLFLLLFILAGACVYDEGVRRVRSEK